ncbi:hypothetical protein K523DRAFT_61758 [Schizophyllum commune Tattone D]|nr:hypothetical protein K523DRAFT_61758 [Schizophyllum commune Tattone D]
MYTCPRMRMDRVGYDPAGLALLVTPVILVVLNPRQAWERRREAHVTRGAYVSSMGKSTTLGLMTVELERKGEGTTSMLASNESTMLFRCVQADAKAQRAAIVHRGATARSYDPGNSTRCNSGQPLASVSYSTSAMSAQSDTFSTSSSSPCTSQVARRPLHASSTGAFRCQLSRRRRADHELAQRAGLAVHRKICNQRARRLRGELQAEHAEALDRAHAPVVRGP